MRKVIIIFVLIVMLTGCNNGARYEEENNLTIDESANISLINELYDDFEDPYQACAEIGSTSCCSLEGDPAWRFSNFEDIMNYEYSDFVYGKVIAQKDINCFSQHYYLEVIKSGLTDDRQIIRISLEASDNMTLGDLYVVNIEHYKADDEYILSQPNATFKVINETIRIHEMFKEELKDKTNIEDFLDYLFEDDVEDSVEAFGPNFDDVDIGRSDVSGSYSIRYENFNDMLECEYCNFIEGKVISISEFNVFVDKVFFEVSKNGFPDQSEIINISVGSGDRALSTGGTYILNLLYEPTNDYYSLSQGHDSIFKNINGEIRLPDRYSTEDIPTSLEEFLFYISLVE